MSNTITVTKNTTSGSERWDVAYTVDASGTKEKTLTTAGTLLDRNIKVAVTTPEGAYGASVDTHSITTIPVVTPSIGGNITDITTTTQPSGTNGTDYWTLDPGGSVTTTGVSTASGKATVGTAGYVATGNKTSSNSTVNITPTVAAGTNRYLQKVSGSIGGSASNGSATAVLTNTDSINTITDISGKTAGTDYWGLKATATTNAGSYTPKYTVSAAGYLGSTVTGSAQTVSVTADSTGKTIYIPKATYSTSAGVTTIGTAGYLPANTVVTNIATQTPTTAYTNSGMGTYFNAGTSGSYDVSITPNYSNTAGYVAAHNATNNGGIGYWSIKTTSRSASTGYVNLTAGAGTATLTAGTGDSESSDNTSLSLATTAPSSGVYYTLTAKGKGTVSGTGYGKVSTGTGWVTEGTTSSNTSASSSLSSNEATTYGYIVKSVHGDAVSGSQPSSLTRTEGTFQDIEIQPYGYLKIPAGYNPKDRYVFANKADASGESTAASGYSLSVSSISGSDAVTVGTLSSGYYPLTANNLSVTATLTAGTAGWFSSGSATDSDTDGVTVGKIPAAAGSVDLTTTLTKKPAIARSAFTISGVTDAASGAATTTAPTGGVYVKVSSPENTATTTATAKITTAGYSPTNNSFATSSSATYGAAASDATYVPITTATLPTAASSSASGTKKATISRSTSTQYINIPVGYNTDASYYKVSAVPNGTITSGSATIESASYAYNSTNGNFDVTGSATIGAPTVGTAGYVSSTVGTKNTNTATLSTTVGKIAIQAAMSGTAKVTPAISKITTASGNDAVNITGVVSAATTTKPTSGYYVAVQSAGATNDITATPSVTVAGYGTTSNYDATNATLAVGANNSAVTYFPVTAGACTVAGGVLSTSGYTKSDLALTLASGSDTNMSNATSGAKDTTNYPYYFKINGSTPAVSGTTSASVTAITDAHTAGYIPAKSATNFRNAQSASPEVSVNATSGSTYVSLKSATLSASSTDATATTTVAPGTVSIAANDTAVSGKTRLAWSPSTATSGISTYYVALKATAAANSTGTTSAISGTANAGVSAAGYAPTTLTGSGTVSGTATAKTSAKDSSVYYVPVPTAAGSVTLTTTLTKKPSISRSAFTISGVTDAASGAATTTAPTSGVYVKVSSAANTATTTATAKITTAGYSPTNDSFATSSSATYGASASSATYVPITTATLPTAASSSASGTKKATISRSTSTQYINIPVGYNTAAAYYQISATANGSATTPATTITANPTISVNSSTGLITASASATQSVTPTVSAGYVSSGTAGTITVSGSNTSQLTTKAATTYNTSTSNQTIAAGTYLTGKQTIRAVTTSGISAANILEGVVVKVGDSAKAGRIIDVTGTLKAGNTEISGAYTCVMGSGSISKIASMPAVASSGYSSTLCRANIGSKYTAFGSPNGSQDPLAVISSSLTASSVSSFFGYVTTRPKGGSVGNYGIFGVPYDYGEFGFSAVNDSLTKSSISGSYTYGSTSAFAQVGNYLLCAGGYSGSYYASTAISINSSLTKANATALSTGRGSMWGTSSSWGKAVFAGGRTSSGSSTAVDMYDTSLTKTTATLPTATSSGIDGTFLGNYILLVSPSGGSAYNSSFTRTALTVSGAQSGAWPTRAGGNYVVLPYFDYSSYSNKTRTWNTSLTESTTTACSYSFDGPGGSVGPYAIFFSPRGGSSGGSAYLEGYDGGGIVMQIQLDSSSFSPASMGYCSGSLTFK